MKKRNAIVLICTSLLVGLVVGAVTGFSAASGTWVQMMEPVFVSTADQAHNTLVLLETDRQEELRLYLEAEIQRGIDYLDRLEQEGRIPEDSPMLLVQARLREYEQSHGFQTPNRFLGNSQ